MRKTKSREVKPSDVWWCETCKDNKEMSFDEMKAHMKDKHNITELKGKRETLMHMDGDTWFSWQFKVTIGNVVLTNSTCQPRARDDIMRYA